MHELALTQSLLSMALDLCADANRSAESGPQTVAASTPPRWRVQALYVQVGTLTGVVPEALRFAFETLAAGTPAAGAALILEDDPALLLCPDCGARGPAALPLPPVCPVCGAAVVVQGGHALTLQRVVLSDAPAGAPPSEPTP